MRTPWQRGADDGHSGGRHRHHGTNGFAPDGMHTEPVELDERRFAATDLAAVHADEELIAALAGERIARIGGGTSGADGRLVHILQAWRAEVEAEPVPSLVTVDEAVNAIRSGRVGQRRSRLLVPIASAAAILAVAMSGMVLGAHDARPGDPLWAVSKVLYQERAQSVEAAVAVQIRLKKARQAMLAGRTEEARAELAAAGANLDGVRDEEGKDELAEQAGFLGSRLQTAQPGVPVDLSVPTAAVPGSTSPSSSQVKPPPSSSSVVRPPSAPPSSAPAPAPNSSGAGGRPNASGAG